MSHVISEYGESLGFDSIETQDIVKGGVHRMVWDSLMFDGKWL